MLYVNMSHDDIDYENKTNKELSFTFSNEVQDKMVIDALLWLGKAGKERKLTLKKTQLNIKSLNFI